MATAARFATQIPHPPAAGSRVLLMVKLALVLAAVYGLIAVAAFIAQRKLMYFPDPRGWRPSSFALTGVEERVLTAPDGARAHRLVRPRSPRPAHGPLFPRQRRQSGQPLRARAQVYRPRHRHLHAELSRLQRLDGPAERARQRRRRQARLRGADRGGRGARGHHPLRRVARLRRSPSSLRPRSRWPASFSMRPTRRSSTSRPAPIRIFPVRAVPVRPLRDHALLGRRACAAARHPRGGGRGHSRRDGACGLCRRQRAQGDRHLPRRRPFRPPSVTGRARRSSGGSTSVAGERERAAEKQMRP